MAVVFVLNLFTALLSFRGISTPSLPAQGEQRRSFYFNIRRDIPAADVTAYTKKKGRLRCHKRPKSREETPKEGSDSGVGLGGSLPHTPS